MAMIGETWLCNRDTTENDVLFFICTMSSNFFFMLRLVFSNFKQKLASCCNQSVCSVDSFTLFESTSKKLKTARVQSAIK